MGRIDKTFALFLTLIIAVSCLTLLTVKPANAQPEVSTSSAPVFTLKFIDNSYYVPPTTTSTTDPYTGNVTTITKSGYYIENKSIEAIISNNLGASYYDFRFKGHYTDQWSYFPSDPNSVSGYNQYDAYSVPCQADSSSLYTTIALTFLPNNIPVNGELDVQIQALFGGYRAVPYGHSVPLPAPTYDFYFNGTVSNWSNSQTLVYNGTDYILPASTSSPTSSSIPSPSPTVPEFPASTLIPLMVTMLCLAVMVRHRKTISQNKPNIKRKKA
jgi:hypothetical protein